jgi:hypothetical protein
MSLEVTVEGVRLGLSEPLFLLAFPVVAGLFGWLLVRQADGVVYERRGRTLLFASRLVVALLLVVSAAGPYTVSAQEVPGDPSVTMLVDRSASMATVEDRAGELATAIEERGVAVETQVVGSGTRSRIGDGIATGLARNGSVLVVSDGQVTDGRSLSEAVAIANSVNASINAVNLSVTRTERFVRIGGPSKTSTSVENTFTVQVGGVDPNGTSADLVVSVDGEEVEREEIDGTGGLRFTYNFSSTGSHRVTARVESDDRYDRNDVARTTVRVVEPPRILYVANDEFPLADVLGRLYEVDRRESIPGNLSSYYAVVVQDMTADDLGNVSALQRAVINGTGLVTVGGRNAFEHGGYRDSTFIDMLPVEIGAGGRISRLVIAVDISGSTTQTLSVQQALALDAIEQLGDDNRVGVIGFNQDAFRVANLTRLGNSREFIRQRIRRLQSSGSTDIGGAIQGGTELLGGGSGTIIVLTDGYDARSDAPAVARRAREQGIRVITVGVGRSVRSDYLRTVALEGGGTYLRADQTNRLRILFGGSTRQFQGSGLTVLDRSHFITSGVTFTAQPPEGNAVSVADRADYLVAGPQGKPAIATWRYGLGRVTTLTAYGDDGTLGGLLSEPDSLAVSKSVNWAIGDPERLETGIIEVPDARVGEPVTVTYEGATRPNASGVQFVRDGENRYRATLVPEAPGFETVLDAKYAVNYPREYGGFGFATELENAVSETDGRIFSSRQPDDIAQFVKQRARHVEDVRESWQWLVLLLALVAFLVETAARRLYRITRLRT